MVLSCVILKSFNELCYTQEPFCVDRQPVAIVSGLGNACHKLVVSYHISRFVQFYNKNISTAKHCLW